MTFDAELLAEFIAAYNEEYRRLAIELKTKSVGRQRDRVALDRKISNLVEAICDGRSSPAMLAKLSEIESQRAKTQADLTPATLDAPAPHPGIALAYANSVTVLREALAQGRRPRSSGVSPKPD